VFEGATMGAYLEMLRVIKLVLYQDILVKNKGKKCKLEVKDIL